uniref:Autophagy-related protein 7 n=1 Tax=Anopheles culicifacies TaxID=139723 RepID=A0A182M647_9DIPT
MAGVAIPDRTLKFLPLRSFINSDFWHKYAEIKIDIDRLDDSGRPIYGTLALNSGKCTMLEVACSSFNAKYHDESQQGFRCKGILLNHNTLEYFKSCDKNMILRNQAVQFYHDLMKQESIQSSADLVCFVLLSFADLKTYKFFHWFAFPVPTELTYRHDDEQPILSNLNENLKITISQFLYQKPMPNEPFFIYHAIKGIKLLPDYIKHHNTDANFRDENMEHIYFCYYDPTSVTNSVPVSWHLRQMLTYLVITSPVLAEQGVKFIRVTGSTPAELQLSLMTIYLPKHVTDANDLKSWAGWESDGNGKYLPRVTSLNDSMAPESIAGNAVDLNLKLMKWRLIPTLNLAAIKQVKCLLLGAGTLGCNVARSLMAWGVTNITILDCGKVSISNPIRQTLYRFDDALNGGRPKATTASERLLDINPAAKIVGVDLKIPMPGHPIGQRLAETKEILNKLERLIKENDIIYLLTDSRESRWLPTMLGAFYNKTIINAALGFDSYLVMRHGKNEDNNIDAKTVVGSCPAGFRKIDSCDLGCYFCNDIVAPGNSMKDRTLDQQCTVTRPAVSNMAAALAVELMVSLIQHGNAPAYYRIPKSDPFCREQEPEGLLGIIPHSIRGNIATLQSMITATERYRNCVACSSSVLERYACNKEDFIINVINGTESLETVAGLNNIMSSIVDGNETKVKHCSI